MLTVIRNSGIQLLICTLFGSQYPEKNKENLIKIRIRNEESTKYSHPPERGQDIELDS